MLRKQRRRITAGDSGSSPRPGCTSTSARSTATACPAPVASTASCRSYTPTSRAKWLRVPVGTTTSGSPRRPATAAAAATDPSPPATPTASAAVPARSTASSSCSSSSRSGSARTMTASGSAASSSSAGSWPRHAGALVGHQHQPRPAGQLGHRVERAGAGLVLLAHRPPALGHERHAGADGRAYQHVRRPVHPDVDPRVGDSTGERDHREGGARALHGHRRGERRRRRRVPRRERRGGGRVGDRLVGGQLGRGGPAAGEQRLEHGVRERARQRDREHTAHRGLAGRPPAGGQHGSDDEPEHAVVGRAREALHGGVERGRRQRGDRAGDRAVDVVHVVGPAAEPMRHGVHPRGAPSDMPREPRVTDVTGEGALRLR